MTTRRRARARIVVAVVGLVVVAVLASTAFAMREYLEERWLLHRFDTATGEERRSITRRLAELGSAEGARKVAALIDADQRAAILTLVDFGSLSVAPLLDELESAGREKELTILAILRRIGPRGTEALVHEYPGRPEHVRLRILHFVGKLSPNDPRVIELYCRSLWDTSISVRRRCVASLGPALGGTPPREYPELLRSALRRVSEDEDELVRRDAKRLLEPRRVPSDPTRTAALATDGRTWTVSQPTIDFGVVTEFGVLAD